MGRKKSTKPLPSDPEGMNDQRAEAAEVAIHAFMGRTRTDYEDALVDLLGDLMHWADREDRMSFDGALETARMHYVAETEGENAADAYRKANWEAAEPVPDGNARLQEVIEG